jgi:AmmeMemoRadiSam system protein B
MTIATLPTLEETRRAMGIPSTDEVRGQRDAVGYAATPEGMRKAWQLSAEPPMPEAFGAEVAPGVLGVIGPHDDYICTARVYRRVFPLVTARTVILVGVFHGYRRFGIRDRLVLDPYRAWRSPDGEIPVSSLRDQLAAALPAGMAMKDAAAHDSEHSLEGIAYFMRHARPELEIVPILVPAASFERFEAMAHALGAALAASIGARDWRLGRDVAIVISTDGTHYGEDFAYAPYGAGGVAALEKARAHDRELMRETMSGPLHAAAARRFLETVVDPADPDRYRVTWCGRFSVTFGMLLLEAAARSLGLPPPRGIPLALGVSVDTPELALRDCGIAPTAPANLYHFVTHPAAAFV